MRAAQLDWFSLWPRLPARYRGEQAVIVRAEVTDDGVTLRMEAANGAPGTPDGSLCCWLTHRPEVCTVVQDPHWS